MRAERARHRAYGPALGARLSTAFLTLALAGSVVGYTTAGSGSDRSGLPAGVHVVGDSIAYWAHLHAGSSWPSGWTIDAVPGRSVSSLSAELITPTAVAEEATTHVFRPRARGRISLLVIALGTNAPDDETSLADAEAGYRAGIARLRRLPIWAPGPKRVVLVTPYTASWLRADNWDAHGAPFDARHWTDRVAVQAEAIDRIAARDDGVCVMPWARRIAEHPASLPDGIHPDAEGERLWSRLLLEAVRSCRD